MREGDSELYGCGNLGHTVIITFKLQTSTGTFLDSIFRFWCTDDLSDSFLCLHWKWTKIDIQTQTLKDRIVYNLKLEECCREEEEQKEGMKCSATMQLIRLNYYTNLRKLWQFVSFCEQWIEYVIHDNETHHTQLVYS